MFGWIFGKEIKNIKEETRKSFFGVREDMDKVGKWLKHLETQDKQLFDIIMELKKEISSIKDEIESLRQGVDMAVEGVQDKQLFKELPVLGKQTAVEGVQEAVQTAVQTDNFFEILKRLSSNEKLVLYALLNSEMKLSYEDIAIILGKERSTVRGQINSIKQKGEGIIEEVVEKNGKKRVFIPEEMREKLQKYAKVRVKDKKRSKNSEILSEK